MITLTIVQKVKKGKAIGVERKFKMFRSYDKAKKEIAPIVKEMRLAEVEKREPDIYIDAVSYDTESERTLLLEMKAIKSIDNENRGGY